MTDYTQAQVCAALAGWSFKRLGEREVEIQCPTFSTPLVVSLDVADRRLRAFYSLAADLVEAAEQPPLLRMLATRARSFPGYPLGYHIPEVFAALGEEPPQPDQSPAASMTYGQARQLVQEMVDAQPSPAEAHGLAPCPFCGEQPKTVERPDNIDGTEFFFAAACYCGGYSACAHKMAVRKTPEEAKAAVVAAWNTRAAHPQPKGLTSVCHIECDGCLDAGKCAFPGKPAEPVRYPHPDEDDAVTLWAEIHRLRAAVQGPDGYATWQEAATAERVRRVAAEKALAAAQAPAPAPELPAQSVKSEREAFDAWVLTVPYVHTPWMAWMKRAALAARLTQAPAVGAGDERQDVGGHIRAAANARVAQQADDDTRRLDYLQKKQATISLVPDGRDEKGTRHAFMVGGWHCSVNRDVRASIDAAMGESHVPVQGSV